MLDEAAHRLAATLRDDDERPRADPELAEAAGLDPSAPTPAYPTSSAPGRRCAWRATSTSLPSRWPGSRRASSRCASATARRRSPGCATSSGHRASTRRRSSSTRRHEGHPPRRRRSRAAPAALKVLSPPRSQPARTAIRRSSPRRGRGSPHIWIRREYVRSPTCAARSSGFSTSAVKTIERSSW